MSINTINSKSSNKLENILIIGNGGRENALAWAIQKNDLIKKIYLLPGNAGSKKINKSERINLDLKNTKVLTSKLKFLNIDLVVIGPETPLAEGLGEVLRRNNFDVFGPGPDGAKLESSKSWAKEFMKDANIPTANFWKVKSLKEAKKIIFTSPNPLVVKADGLASGKGVFIPESKEASINATEEIFKGKFGNAGEIIVLEEKIEGPEVSVFALCDGKKYVLLPTAQDHKRLNENDKGPNTGGMGAYSPTPMMTKSLLETITKEIIEPTIDTLFSGCVIATSKGYPHNYKKGFPITYGNIDFENCQIFDSGTSLNSKGEFITDGGRVLSIVCQGEDFNKVFEKAYKNLEEISFDGIYYRKDIGYQVRIKKIAERTN